MRTPVMETSMSIASNNENDQEITPSPDLSMNCLTGIIDTSPKYKVISIAGMPIVNAIRKAEIIKTSNDFAQVFLDQLSNMADDYDGSWYQHHSQSTNEKKTDKGEINILACYGNYLNPEYFSEGFTLEYKCRGRTNNTSSCKKTTDHNKGTTNTFQKFIVTSGLKPTAPLVCFIHTVNNRHLNTVGHALSIGKHAMSLHLHLSDGPNVTRPTLLYMFPCGEGKREEKHASPTNATVRQSVEGL